jgi:transposase InsO family protein
MGTEWLRLMRAAKVPKSYRLRVRERLVVLEYARTHSVRAAARRFGLDRKTVRAWRNRWGADGVRGLVPRYPKTRARKIPDKVLELITHARVDLGYGSTRTQLWLWRVQRLRVAQSTIQRVVRALKLPPVRPVRKRRPKQLKLFERERPGDCVQVDVKFVRVGSRRFFQYTAIDDCSRYRVLRLSPRLDTYSSLKFLAELRRAMPFPIRRLQTDNGPEFPLAFRLSVQEAGIEHRYIRPRRPQQNGKVERSHRIDHEEFWSRNDFVTVDDAERRLAAWEHHYNGERFSMALRGRTPIERLGDFQIAA